MSNPQVKFVSRNDGGWQGNGYGNEPNSYDVLFDNKDVGMLWHCSDRGWRFHRKEVTYFDGVRFEYERNPSVQMDNFNKAKDAVRQLFS